MNVLKKIVLLLPCCSCAATCVSGVNETMNMEPGARSAALGSATMAVDGDYLGLVSNPYQLANVRYLWASFSHTAYFEDTQYDYASVAIPLGLDQGLGISFARFGADDIPYIREGDPLPEGSDYETLSIADWMLSATWGKRLFGRFELGVGFHLLYRDMDQSGFGFRGDAGLRYRILDDLYVAGLLKGWTSSASVWGSGEFEYSAPDLYLAAVTAWMCATCTESSGSTGRVPVYSGMNRATWGSRRTSLAESPSGKTLLIGFRVGMPVSSSISISGLACARAFRALPPSRALPRVRVLSSRSSCGSTMRLNRIRYFLLFTA